MNKKDYTLHDERAERIEHLRELTSRAAFERGVEAAINVACRFLPDHHPALDAIRELRKVTK